MGEEKKKKIPPPPPRKTHPKYPVTGFYFSVCRFCSSLFSESTRETDQLKKRVVCVCLFVVVWQMTKSSLFTQPATNVVKRISYLHPSVHTTYYECCPDNTCTHNVPMVLTKCFEEIAALSNIPAHRHTQKKHQNNTQ